MIKKDGEEIKDSKDKDTSTTRHTCLVCCEKKPDAVLMECGHGGLFLKILFIYLYNKGICYECGVELLKKLGECPLCRKVKF